MKISKYIAGVMMALGITTAAGASAQTRVLIVGDRSCAGSADTTLVSTDAVAHALVPASGLYLTPGVQPSASAVAYTPSHDATYGSQTMINGLHDVLSSEINGEIVYSILSIDKPMADWSAADLAQTGGTPDYLVWMHGAKDVEAGTSAEAYLAGLKNTLSGFDKTKIVLVQPANAGSAYTSRPLSDEYDMPRHEVEKAMNLFAAEVNGVVVPSYMCYFSSDNRVPRVGSMAALGSAVGKACLGVAKGFKVSAVEPFAVTLAPQGGIFGYTTAFASPVPTDGYEVWRVSGGQPRRLTIEKVAVSPEAVTLAVRERLAAGDIVLYGATEVGTGRANGCRGNIAVDGCPMPVGVAVVETVDNAGDNISGRITCDGTGVAGVTVSDGYELVTTDKDGRYSMSSNKRAGYVFYCLPSGYEPDTEDNGWQVKIHSLLTSADPEVSEVHDFVLKKTDNKNHILIVGADSHLAARNSDKSQFKSGFIKSVNDFRSANPDAKIYSTILGDLAWDQYWYANNYALPDFVNTMTTNKFPFMLFPVMGNHDNDGATPAGSECDHLAAVPFRRVMAPTYYSYNLGDVHYVVLDDIIYKNTYTAGKSYAEGIVGDRDYGRYYTDEQLEWLRRDLATVVDKSTPVVVCFHIQNWALSTNGTFTVSANLENSASDKLAGILSDFSDVHLLSGHTHYNFHARPSKYPNIHENNVAGICATWWWTGKLVGRHICKDGSPGGYAVYTVNGKDISWKYRSSEDNSEPQMRIYDMNAVKAAYKTDQDIKAWLAYDKTQTNYGSIADNLVYVNVFNYDTDWKVEVFEGDKPVEAKRISAQDPLHVICYEVPRYKAAKTVTADFVTNRTNHIFSVQTTTGTEPVTVRLTDSFGNVYTSTLQRPGVYSVDM